MVCVFVCHVIVKYGCSVHCNGIVYCNGCKSGSIGKSCPRRTCRLHGVLDVHVVLVWYSIQVTDSISY